MVPAPPSFSVSVGCSGGHPCEVHRQGTVLTAETTACRDCATRVASRKARTRVTLCRPCAAAVTGRFTPSRAPRRHCGFAASCGSVWCEEGRDQVQEETSCPEIR